MAVLVGNDGIGPWENEEMRAALHLAVQDGRSVIAVLLPGSVEVGTVLRVLLPNELGGGWVTVEVRHCRPEADGWLTGCELIPGQLPL